MIDILCHTFPQGTGSHRDHAEKRSHPSTPPLGNGIFWKRLFPLFIKCLGCHSASVLGPFLSSPQMEAQIPAFSPSSSPSLEIVSLISAEQLCKALLSLTLVQFCPQHAVFTYQENERHSQKFQVATSTYLWCFRRCLFKHSQNQSKLPQTRKRGEQGNTRHLRELKVYATRNLTELS